MTSDGISAEDWDRVHDLAVAVANSDPDDDVEWNAAIRAIRQYLNELRNKYGDLPSLAATEADYAEIPEEAEELFLRAFDLAVQLTDTPNQKEVALSLADLYVSQLSDRARARSWLDIARQWVGPESQDWDEYVRIEQAIDSGGNA